MPAWRLAAFAVGAALIIALILHVGYIAGNSSMPAERWVYDFLKLQDQRLEATRNENRIVVVSGSNGLHGFDGSVFEDRTDYRFVNYSVHAGLALGYAARRLEGKLHPGDIVIAPIELANYKLGEDKKEFQQIATISWLQRHYNQFPFYSYEQIWRAPMETILKGAANFIASPPTIFNFSSVSNQDSCGRFQEKSIRLVQNPGNLNEFCNLYMLHYPKSPAVPKAEVLQFYNSGGMLILPPSTLDGDFNPDIWLLKEIVEGQGAKFIPTWPSILKSRLIPERRRYLVESLYRKQDILRRSGYDLACMMEDYLFEPKYIYDTPLHLNGWGATLRSNRLIDCLAFRDEITARPLTKEDRLSIPVVNMDRTFLGIVRTRLRLHDDLFDFEKVYADLSDILAALGRYHAVHGTYPASDGWSGIGRRPDMTSENWIPGLSPDYIAQLPSDRRGTSDPVQQYIYRSDGKDFKLLGHDAKDCDVALEIVPSFIDSKRKHSNGVCYAYGFWSSQRAAQW